MIDTNIYLFRWPTRRLPGDETAKLVEKLRSRGVAQAWAGSFDALHYQFVANPELPQEHPPYDVYCTADGEYLFLKGQVAGYMQTYYELVELSRGPHWS